MRTLNTAQVVYASTYPQRGFARNLAMLGPGPTGATASPDHAGFIDALLGNPTCAAGAWCADSTGYRFSLKAVCLQEQCTEYLAVATPVSSSTGGRNFCSTSNEIIRYQAGPPLNAPITLQECRKWQPLK
jgi:hypothetical protein